MGVGWGGSLSHSLLAHSLLSRLLGTMQVRRRRRRRAVVARPPHQKPSAISWTISMRTPSSRSSVTSAAAGT